MTVPNSIGIFMQNSPHYVISFFGIIRAGGVVVNLNPMFKAMELAPIIEKTGINMIIVQDTLCSEFNKVDNAGRIETVIVARFADFLSKQPLFSPPDEVFGTDQPFSGTVDFKDILDEGMPIPVCRIHDMDNDLAMLQLTGGTTGVPKAAMISIRSLTIAVCASMHWFGLTPKETSLGIAPFFHIMGLQVTMIPALFAGGKLVILTRFVPAIIAQAIAEKKCTVWVAAPTMITALVNMPTIEQFDFSSLRVIVTGGSPISITLQQRIKEIAPNSQLGEGYGLTEVLAAGGVVTPLGNWKPGFTGIPIIKENDLRIMDLEGREEEMPCNQKGEIAIKGPTVMNGYWNEPEETKKVMKNGWFYTGDIGLMDEDGYLKIVDRKKELILCSGFNVYPTELENTMLMHPAILEVAVIGIPDDYRGESVKAFVVLKDQFKDELTAEGLINWCKDNMAAYKRPHEVEFTESLPKSGAGKILKRLLKK
ncbi:AMP-binding protein [Desulfosarcina ovata]|nr:AMP-binding protein [Desulfosarcina ovata]